MRAFQKKLHFWVKAGPTNAKEPDFSSKSLFQLKSSGHVHEAASDRKLVEKAADFGATKGGKDFMLVDFFHHHGNAQYNGGPNLLECRQQGGNRRRSLQIIDAAAVENLKHKANSKFVDMRQRQKRKATVILVHPMNGLALNGRPHKIFVCELHSLGISSGARGVDNGSKVILMDLGGFGQKAVSQIGRFSPQGTKILHSKNHRQKGRLHVLYLGIEGLAYHHHIHLDVAENCFHLAGGKIRQQGNGNATTTHSGKVKSTPLRHSLAKDCHLFSSSKAVGRHNTSQLLHHQLKLMVGNGLVMHQRQGWSVCKFFQGVAEQGRKGIFT